MEIETIQVVEPQVIPAPTQTRKRLSSLKLGLVITTLTLPLLIYALIPAKPPISPQGNSEAPEVVRQSLATQDISSLAYYLAGSEKYLKEARTLSQNTKNGQTDLQKREIINLLNSSLQMANNAVSYYPTSPEGYVQRARLFEVLSVVDSSAKEKALADHEYASRLISRSVSTDPNVSPRPLTPPDLVRAAPIEEASLISQAIIALPQEGPVETNAKEEDNATRGIATFYAGETDIVIHSEMVIDDKLVYYTATGDTQGEVISLTRKSQIDQQFTLHLSAPLSHDLPVEWWIVE